MDRFRYIDIQNLNIRTMDELIALLNIAYGDLNGLEKYSLDRVRILIGIRTITAEIARRTAFHPKPPSLGM